jgi:hypothetical protein
MAIVIQTLKILYHLSCQLLYSELKIEARFKYCLRITCYPLRPVRLIRYLAAEIKVLGHEALRAALVYLYRTLIVLRINSGLHSTYYYLF